MKMQEPLAARTPQNWKTGCALRVGGAYALFLSCQSPQPQPIVSTLSLCMQKRVDGTFPDARYTAMWHSLTCHREATKCLKKKQNKKNLSLSWKLLDIGDSFQECKVNISLREILRVLCPCLTRILTITFYVLRASGMKLLQNEGEKTCPGESFLIFNSPAWVSLCPVSHQIPLPGWKPRGLLLF